MFEALKEDYIKSKIEKSIKEKWKILMERVNSVDISKDTFTNSKYNDFSKRVKFYTLEDIFIKHYGFDAIIVLPYGKSLKNFRELIPAMSVIYKAEIIAEYSSAKSSVYMRCHIEGLDISDIDLTIFKWYQMFSDSKLRNYSGETFKLTNRKNIHHPTKKIKNEKTEKEEPVVIGNRYTISIPSGLSYDILESKLVDLNKTFGICCLHFNDDTKITTIEIMNIKVPDNEKFELIKLKPWQLYIGMTHYYKPIILDFKTSPNVLIGGQSGSGKTVAMITGLINLILSNDESMVNLYVSMLSDKQDLKIFKNLPHCKYYAKTYNEAYKELQFLSKEVARRNKLFDDSDEYGGIVNIYDYNKKFPNKKIPIIYFVIDEVASFSVNGTEESKEEKETKERCSAFMWKINREGRSAGVYCVLATQRGSVQNLSSEVKGNLGNQICFCFPNIASALTVLGDGDLATLAIKQKKQREFICVSDEVYHGKTLYLDNDMMVKLLKPLMKKDKKFMELDMKGNIIENSNKNNNVIDLPSQPQKQEEIAVTKNKNKTSRWQTFKKG